MEWNWRNAGRCPMDSMVTPARTHSLQRVGGQAGWVRLRLAELRWVPVRQPWPGCNDAVTFDTPPLQHRHTRVPQAAGAPPVQLLLAVGADGGGALVQDGVARRVEQLRGAARSNRGSQDRWIKQDEVMRTGRSAPVYKDTRGCTGTAARPQLTRRAMASRCFSPPLSVSVQFCTCGTQTGEDAMVTTAVWRLRSSVMAAAFLSQRAHPPWSGSGARQVSLTASHLVPATAADEQVVQLNRLQATVWLGADNTFRHA